MIFRKLYFIHFLILFLILCLSILHAQPGNSISKKEIDSLNNLGWKTKQVNLLTAKEYTDKALALSESISYGKGLIDAHKTISVIYLMSSKYDSAKIVIDEFLRLSTKYKDSIRIADAYNYMGTAHHFSGELDKSIESYHTSLKFMDAIGNKRGSAKLYNNIANIYITQRKYDKSLEFHFKSLEIKKDLNDSLSMGKSYGNIGYAYREKKMFVKSLEYYNIALDIYKNTNNRSFLINLYLNIGETYLRKGDLKESLETYSIAQALSEEFKGIREKVYSYLGLGKVHIALGNLQKGITYLEQGKDLAKQINNTLEMQNAYNALSKGYFKQKRYKKAYESHVNYASIKDSLLNESNNKAFEELSAKYETEKKEQENELLKKEAEISQSIIKRQKIINYTGGAILFLVALFAFLTYRANILRKKFLRKIQRQKDKAEKDKELIEKQATKLKVLDETKSRFFANVSHDLRTPLTLILGNLERIMDDEDNYLSAKSQNHLINTQINGKRLLQLTEEINELSLLEDGKLKITPKPVNIAPFFSLMIKLFSSAAESNNIKLDHHSNIPDSVVLMIDTFNFEKIIFNLLSNALKHTSEGGEINISLDLLDEQLDDKSKSVRLEISDTGEGIPEEDLEHIFDRYFQSAKKSYKIREGLGLGLALVQEIIHLFKGEISVKSKLGKGTVFTVVMPLAIPSEEMIEVSESTSSYISKRSNLLYNENDEKLLIKSKKNGNYDKLKAKISEKAKLLIVDDHPEIRAYIKDIIEEEYFTLEANNGMEALKVMENEKIDLVITDLMMPWLDGFELLEKMRDDKNLNHIPALVVSARTSEKDKMKVLDQGVNDFISKPFNTKELLLRIENLLNNKKTDLSSVRKTFINYPNKIDNLEKNILKKINSLVINRIDDNKLSVADLASEIATSERQLYRLIKKIAECTPNEYIKEIRLQYAFDLLQNKKLQTVGEVAKTIGMNNTTYFKKVYKKRFDLDPAHQLNN